MKVRIKVLSQYNTSCFNDHSIARNAIASRKIFEVLARDSDSDKYYLKGFDPEKPGHEWYVYKNEAEIVSDKKIIIIKR